MPTSHVMPESAERLQEIADALWKAKKVLVVTGAGISTNSGIPDFRSKHGLYSLIQAQFEAASAGKDDDSEEERDDPPLKRPRLSGCDGLPATADETPAEDTIHGAPRDQQDPPNTCDSIVVQLPAIDPERFAASLETPQRPSQTGLSALDGSSSPLSSPPPILFDPSEECGSGFTSSAQLSSDSSSRSASRCSSPDPDSDAEETPSSSQPTFSSQSSFSSSRSTLPAMKGRDLFDASIWADPVKTSVFYTFATTLRQKVRDVVPTKSHEFISHLRDANKLVRCYTQNIDEIEEKVGLTTSLVLGPGKKGRFSARSALRAASSAPPPAKDSAESTGPTQEDAPEAGQSSQNLTCSQESIASQPTADTRAPSDAKTAAALEAARDPRIRGVECVFLHGSLRLLRCFRCGQTTPWDEDGREYETLSGRQPSCPRCAGATAAREGRGKRALAVGKLRPDIVLYGEEHPNAHLISPIVQHDISLAPDMLLILGTSLKVHGLKVLVREFSKAVHSRGGKVVFVNFTKPPESVWSDVIDYWVQWDCDAWVQDLKEKKPIMWLPPGPATEELKKPRRGVSTAAKGSQKKSSDCYKGDEAQTGGDLTRGGGDVKKRKRQPKEKKEKKEKKDNTEKMDETQLRDVKEENPPGAALARVATSTPAKFVALMSSPVRDDETNGAYVVWRIREALANIPGHAHERTPTKPARSTPAKRKPRHSAPAQLEAAPANGSLPGAIKQTPVPLPVPPHSFHPAPSRSEAAQMPAAWTPTKPLAETAVNAAPHPSTQADSYSPNYSILSAVKANPRRRRSKKIFEAGSATQPVLVQAQVTEQKQVRKRAKPVETGPVERPRPAEQVKVRERPKSMGDAATVLSVDASWSDTDRIAEQLMMELHPAHSQGGQGASMSETAPAGGALSARTAQSLPQSLQGPETRLEFAQAPEQPLPTTTTLPPLWQLFPDLRPHYSTDNAFFYQDALSPQYGYSPPCPQEWSCADQLQREAHEIGKDARRSRQ